VNPRATDSDAAAARQLLTRRTDRTRCRDPAHTPRGCLFTQSGARQWRVTQNEGYWSRSQRPRSADRARM